MTTITAESLENVLSAVEAAVENPKSEFPNHLQKLKRESQGIPKTLSDEFIRTTRILVTPSHSKSGRFIVITGIDKSGKETQAFNPEYNPRILALSEYLVNKSFKVLKLSLPSYQTSFGSIIASYLGKENTHITIVGNLSKDIAWILWSLDRAQHNQRIEKWLESDSRNVVLSKRWTETNIAYQKPLGISERRVLHFERNLVRVDYTIVLDVPPGLIFVRMKSSGEVPDKYETPEFLSKVSDIYRNLEYFYPIGKILHVNGSGSFEEVNKRLIGIMPDVVSCQTLLTST